jgi:hypothetical protein
MTAANAHFGASVEAEEYSNIAKDAMAWKAGSIMAIQPGKGKS